MHISNQETTEIPGKPPIPALRGPREVANPVHLLHQGSGAAGGNLLLHPSHHIHPPNAIPGVLSAMGLNQGGQTNASYELILPGFHANDPPPMAESLVQ